MGGTAHYGISVGWPEDYPEEFQGEKPVECGERSPSLTPNFTVCVFSYFLEVILDRIIHLIKQKANF